MEGRNVELRLTFRLWRNLMLEMMKVRVYIFVEIHSSTLFLYFSDYCFYGLFFLKDLLQVFQENR